MRWKFHQKKEKKKMRRRKPIFPFVSQFMVCRMCRCLFYQPSYIIRMFLTFLRSSWLSFRFAHHLINIFRVKMGGGWNLLSLSFIRRMGKFLHRKIYTLMRERVCVQCVFALLLAKNSFFNTYSIAFARFVRQTCDKLLFYDMIWKT